MTAESAQQVADAAAALAGPAVVGCAIVDAALPAAVRARRERRHRRGRRAATSALDALGIAECRVGRAPDGRPRWPLGVSGSISHTADLSVAVAGPAADGRLGVDVEPATRRGGAEAARALSRDSELTLVHHAGLPVLAGFCAKEAALKAAAEAGVPADLEGLRIVALPSAPATGHVAVQVPGLAVPVPVRIAETAGHVVAVARLR